MIATALLLFLGATAVAVGAQEPPPPASPGGWGTQPSAPVQPATFWWDAAVGVAGLQVSCDFCQSGVDGGPSVELSGGVYATSRVGVGLSLAGWTWSDGDLRETLYRASAVTRYEPRRLRGLHLLGAAGWSWWSAEDLGFDAFHLSVGMGWSYGLGSRWAIGSRVMVDVAPNGTLANAGTPVAPGTRMSMGRLVFFVRNR